MLMFSSSSPRSLFEGIQRGALVTAGRADRATGRKPRRLAACLLDALLGVDVFFLVAAGGAGRSGEAARRRRRHGGESGVETPAGTSRAQVLRLITYDLVGVLSPQDPGATVPGAAK